MEKQFRSESVGMEDLRIVEDLLTPKEREKLYHDLKRIHDLRIRAEVESRNVSMY